MTIVDDPFIEYIASRRQLVAKTVDMLESLAADFREELSDLDAAMKVRLQMAVRPGLAEKVESITEIAAPERAAEAPPPKLPDIAKPPDATRPAEPKVDGRTRRARPAGIPGNLVMAQEAIRGAGRSLTAGEIRQFVIENYWADPPEYWKACLYDFVDDGRLVKDGTKFALPVEKPEPRAPERRDPPPAAVRPPPAVAKPPAPPPKPAPAAQPAPRPGNAGRRFEHKGREIELTAHEWRAATALGVIIDAGFIDYAGLLRTIFKGEALPGMPARDWLTGMLITINPRLRHIGLEVFEVPKMGFGMREIAR